MSQSSLVHIDSRETAVSRYAWAYYAKNESNNQEAKSALFFAGKQSATSRSFQACWDDLIRQPEKRPLNRLSKRKLAR